MDLGASVSALTSLPLDWVILAVVFLVVSADTVRSGPAHTCALALSFPVSLLLFGMVSQTFLLGNLVAQFNSAPEQAAVILVLVVILFVCFNQMLYAFDRSASLLFSCLAGLATAIVVITMWLQTPQLLSLWHFDPQFQTIFGAPYRFYWLFGAYLVLAFAAS